MPLEGSRAGRALLAKLKTYIKDYAASMEAWDFISEALQGQALQNCFAWQATGESGAPVTMAILTTDRGLFEFAFTGATHQYQLTRLSDICSVREARHNDNGPTIELRICQSDGQRDRTYCIRGKEETQELREFLHGLRQQLQK